ncbi:zinc knuckle CX2CX4HX4C containing protein [Tanacetum coccineum]
MPGGLHWDSPIPYLFGGMFLVFSLMSCALITLACSYKKAYSAYSGDNHGDDEKPSSCACNKHLSLELEPEIVIVMPGDTNPTYIAKPLPTMNNVSSTTSLSECGCNNSTDAPDPIRTPQLKSTGFKSLSSSITIDVEPVMSSMVEGDGIGVSKDDPLFSSCMEEPIMQAASISVKGSFADVVGGKQPASANKQQVVGDRSETHDLVSSYLHVPCVPGMANVVALLGVPLNTLGDIDKLTKDIELGKLDVWSDLPSEKRTEVMETIWAMWDAFMVENPNVVMLNLLIREILTRWKTGSRVVTNLDDHIPCGESHCTFCHCSRNNINIMQCARGGMKLLPISWGRSSIAHCLIEINADDYLQESQTMGVPLIKGSRKKKKDKSKSTNGGQFSGPSVKQTVRYEPKATTSTPMKGDTNLGNTTKSLLKNQPLKATAPATKEVTTSNSYAALDVESDEDVVNVYDESANLFHTTRTGESSSFMAAVG